VGIFIATASGAPTLPAGPNPGIRVEASPSDQGLPLVVLSLSGEQELFRPPLLSLYEDGLVVFRRPGATSLVSESHIGAEAARHLARTLAGSGLLGLPADIELTKANHQPTLSLLIQHAGYWYETRAHGMDGFGRVAEQGRIRDPPAPLAQAVAYLTSFAPPATTWSTFQWAIDCQLASSVTIGRDWPLAFPVFAARGRRGMVVVPRDHESEARALVSGTVRANGRSWNCLTYPVAPLHDFVARLREDLATHAAEWRVTHAD